MIRRLILAPVLLLLLASCAPHRGAAPKGPLSLDDLLIGAWGGSATLSPLGVQPYAIIFQREDGETVGETPHDLLGTPLPVGAYQRFVLDKTGQKLSYRTSMGDRGFYEGVLDLVPAESGPTQRVFCDPGPDCVAMKIRLEAADSTHLRLAVSLRGQPHVDISLEPMTSN